MKLTFLIFIALCIFAFIVQAQDDVEEPHYDDFCIEFFEKSKYEKEAGFICGSIASGEGAGSKKGNMIVTSFKAPDFLQVTLYEGVVWSGKHITYEAGSQEKISPPMHVRSVKWKHIGKEIEK